MANTKLLLDPGRQYPLTLIQSFTFEHANVKDEPVMIASLPRGAVLTGGSLIVDKAFNAGAKFKVGFLGADAMHGDLDIASTGAKALTLTHRPSDATALFLKPNAALTEGAATLLLTYVIINRANEAQP